MSSARNGVPVPMIGGIALHAMTVVRLGVRPRVAGIAVREGRRVVVLSGEGNAATIAAIVVIAVVTAARGRIEDGDHERSSREPPIEIAASRGSTGTSGRRSHRRTG
ncbi:MAG TPA: hypothetical protein VF179_03830 [Thermoanaerobaculia bacterium]|nr:hypothetical protein [Thermoanaerobaculia bacterium]